MSVTMAAVQSSNVREIGYDPVRLDLYVRYKTGVYVYFGVPHERWTQLQRVITLKGSVGQFMNEVIKPGYECRKLHRLVSLLEAAVSDQVQVRDGGGIRCEPSA